MVLRVLELKPPDRPEQQMGIQNLGLGTVCPGGKSYSQFLPLTGTGRSPGCHVYYRELAMPLGREVSLGDTIYTEK